MVTGLLISAIVAGVIGLTAGLALQVGAGLAVICYVAGGVCGAVLFTALALVRGPGDFQPGGGGQRNV